MENWPADGKAVYFSDLADPLVEALKHCYHMERRNEDRDVDYKGYDIGERDKATQPSPVDRLTAASLSEEFEDQGRTAAKVIIGLAVTLGIEQGRRLHQEDMANSLQIISLLAARPESPETEQNSEAEAIQDRIRQELKTLLP